VKLTTIDRRDTPGLILYLKRAKQPDTQRVWQLPSPVSVGRREFPLDHSTRRLTLRFLASSNINRRQKRGEG